MELKTIKKIFDFIKEKEGREAPFIWKLLNNEPFKEEDLIIKIDLDLRFRKVPPTTKRIECWWEFIFTIFNNRILTRRIRSWG
jgi:hypothetical protein